VPRGEAEDVVAFEAVREIEEPIEFVHIGRWTDLRLHVSGGSMQG
jgi:hypothetical protein